MDILLILKALILGVVEGATEFLPISSTGHLIIAGDLLNFLSKDKRDVFEIIIQLGAILAVIWEYRAKFIHVASHLNETKSRQLVINLFIAFLPLAILGLAFHHQIKDLLFNPKSVSIALIVGGFAILFIEKKLPAVKINSVDDMDWKLALKVGFAQAIALIPGASRAGSTIIGGMCFGLSRTAATEFSFFLAVPVMFAATFYDLYKSRDLLSANDLTLFLAGFITAFIAALIVIKVLIRYVANHDFTAFAWYRIVFGAIVLAYFWH
ncbi:undecaprenyl-diphosphate phosphatase [Methylotenera sp.]|uniref:undecaprenyl-diphosphate phosphatase n=1 Tax=Methylotenera sp. TaxID=2051956 RepID=UPI002489342F|nr:undecaprenyl-diphosphate phosphatase [Methylotenera sp.]MDI1299795.1 undecaprenyl-diphosphate phosphatase [Methylotenera sp.]